MATRRVHDVAQPIPLASHSAIVTPKSAREFGRDQQVGQGARQSDQRQLPPARRSPRHQLLRLIATALTISRASRESAALRRTAG